MSKIIREVDDCKDIKLTIHSTLNEFMHDYPLLGWIRNKPENSFKNILESQEKLLEENNALRQQISKIEKEDLKSLNHIDEMYLTKLIDIFKNKVFDTLYSESTNIYKRVSAMDEFIVYYDSFCKGIEKPNIFEMTTIYKKTCPYFEDFKLLKNKNNVYTITDLGKTFYSLLISQNIINNIKCPPNQ